MDGGDDVAGVGGAPTLPGSHALPPIDLSELKTPAGDEPDFLPAGDPDRIWRKRGRWINTVMREQPDDPDALTGSNALDLLDDAFALAEWGLLAACPRVQAMAARHIRALEMIKDATTDGDHRSVSIGRELGIQPPSGASAGYRLALCRRDILIRKAWQAVPAWRDLPPGRVAPKIVAAFALYIGNRTAEQRDRDSAPQAAEPIPTFWRIARLGRDDEVVPPRPGLAVVMPEERQLASILRSR